MAKFYFREDNDERCYLKKDILADMKYEGITSLKIFEAKRMKGESYFWCSINQECGEVGQSCGKTCSDYKPRNGKNGRCRYSCHCYEHTNTSIILSIEPKKSE